MLKQKEARKCLFLRSSGFNQHLFSNEGIPTVPFDKWTEDHEELFVSFAHGREHLADVGRSIKLT